MSMSLRVLLVTTWQTACGIAMHSEMLKEAVEAADRGIEIVPWPDLDPASLQHTERIDLVWLNYHAALHSRWTPEWIAQWRGHGPGGCTFHDTGVPNSDHCKAIIDACDTAVVHEPFDDLPAEKVHYWRMGVPGPVNPILYGKRDRPSATSAWQAKPIAEEFKAWADQPVLGSIGFPFQWKNFDLLAKISGELGWALVLIAPTATPEQIATWRALNPDLYVRSDFVSRREAIGLLAGCDATAFAYVCANTGQSGAILQGIAARKPVLAFSSCRQFRALANDDLGKHTIMWAETVEQLRTALLLCPIGRVDSGIVALAEQDGWPRLGRMYAELFRSLV